MLVADDLEVVGEAGSGREAISQAAALRPDVVLIDLRMPEMDGVAAAAKIVGTGPRVLVLTTYETDSDILRAVEAGASGYLLKDSTTQDLIAAIRAGDVHPGGDGEDASAAGVQQARGVGSDGGGHHGDGSRHAPVTR